MREPDDVWERRRPEPKADIFAIGVISLNYGQLESIFGILFGKSVGMTEVQTSLLFQRIQNNVRLEIFRNLSSPRNDMPIAFLDRLNHFGEGYRICVDNRNAVMHSHSSGSHYSVETGNSGLVLAKYTNSGKRMYCLATRDILRSVADSIDRFSLFGASLCTDLDILKSRQRRGDETYQPSPLSDKPELPAGLRWMTEATFQESLHRHRSSQG
jgi:hypothetical protein